MSFRLQHWEENVYSIDSHHAEYFLKDSIRFFFMCYLFGEDFLSKNGLHLAKRAGFNGNLRRKISKYDYASIFSWQDAFYKQRTDILNLRCKTLDFKHLIFVQELYHFTVILNFWWNRMVRWMSDWFSISRLRLKCMDFLSLPQQQVTLIGLIWFMSCTSLLYSTYEWIVSLLYSTVLMIWIVSEWQDSCQT